MHGDCWNTSCFGFNPTGPHHPDENKGNPSFYRVSSSIFNPLEIWRTVWSFIILCALFISHPKAKHLPRRCDAEILAQWEILGTGTCTAWYMITELYFHKGMIWSMTINKYNFETRKLLFRMFDGNEELTQNPPVFYWPQFLQINLMSLSAQDCKPYCGLMCTINKGQIQILWMEGNHQQICKKIFWYHAFQGFVVL